jgi:hypothetical protein
VRVAVLSMLGPGADLRVTEFDLDRACGRIVAESSYPDVREWAEYYVRSTAGDADALEAFGPRDGRDLPGGRDGGGQPASTAR